MMTKEHRHLWLAVGFSVAACTANNSKPPAVVADAPVSSLAQAYRAYFPIGAAVEAQNLATDADLLVPHASSLTAERSMKWGRIHPIPGNDDDSYRFTEADAIVDFATTHGMKVRGHALVWHQEAPSWVFESDDPKAERPSKQELYTRMREHITTLLKRYAGKVYCWDVVNEALAESSGDWRASSPWQQLVGEDSDNDGIPDYITLAFELARAADPTAKLFYNDYGIESGSKLEGAYRLVKTLKAKGLIDGVGIQGHWSVYAPDVGTVRQAIERFASLGVEVQVTELDLSLFNWGDNSKLAAPSERLLEQQAAKYQSLFRMFREEAVARRFTGVTFWGIADDHTWLDVYPVPGRKDSPLLFDTQHQPKKAYWAVLAVAQEPQSATTAVKAPEVVRTSTLNSSSTVTINAAGDVQLGRAWPEDKADLPPDGPRTLLAHVSDLLSQGDLSIGNLETALADTGESRKCGKRSKICYAFRAPTAYAQQLAELGFNVLTIANNHSGDFGDDGRAQTRQALQNAGIAMSGVVGDIASIERQGVRIAVIGFGFGNGMYRLHDITAARELVANLAREHDVVVVTVHAGAEGTAATRVTKSRELFLGEDRGDVYAFAHAVVDAGADLVLGHGPHVLRAIELYRGRLIAYSLGNFCAWRSFSLVGPLAQSGILRVTLQKSGELQRAELVPTKLVGEGIAMLDTSKRAVSIVRELSLADFGTSVLNAEGVYQAP